MSWFANLVPPPHTRGPLSLHSFARDLLPPLLCYYASAILVLLPGTRSIRLALLPITLRLAFRAATHVDVAHGYNDERLIYLNQGFVLTYTTLGMRAMVWSFQQEPYRRVHPATETRSSEDDVPEIPLDLQKNIAVDAFELCCNLRGCGWNWSHGTHVPPETRPTTSTTAFISATFLSLVLHLTIFDILHYSVQWFSPSTIGSPKGGTIFNENMSFPSQYLWSSTITILSGLTIYCAIQTSYDVATLFGILIFRQDLVLWPPLFNSPWIATSLADYWAKRWHQLFRHNFVSIGARPLSLFAGRVGGVLGAFLASGIFHDFGLWGMGNGAEFRTVGGFFIMMGFGIILEHTWRKLTGHRVGGLSGRIWTLLWLIGWGNVLVDAWCRKGLVGSVFLPHHLRPTTYIYGTLPQS